VIHLQVLANTTSDRCGRTVKAGTVELAVAVSEHNEPVELQQMSVKR
jgi:hypothetical protein